MTVTTDKATTVHYWQKSDNLACLSAGTAYIDSACTTQCGFVTSKYGASASDTESKLATDFRFLDRYYRRYFDKSLNGQEAANATVVALTSPPAGVTRRLLQTCAQVPEVPGCIDYTSCSLLQTPKCLCKSSCDLVPPAELDFDGDMRRRGQVLPACMWGTLSRRSLSTSRHCSMWPVRAADGRTLALLRLAALGLQAIWSRSGGSPPKLVRFQSRSLRTSVADPPLSNTTTGVNQHSPSLQVSTPIKRYSL
ncbi:hypothetical protein T484DRAFT_2448381 [Baffinella frigidus]|nr:hypothetical protein T484DRAFT_2448381 [Cryptophyta sp. CCMP2293]